MPLIKIQKNSYGEKIVDAKDLYNFLNIQRAFLTWIEEKIREYEFIENEDFTISNDAYLLTLDTAKEITMIENSPSGKAARKYFIQCEKKYKENVAIRYILHQNAAVRYYAISVISLINKIKIKEKIKENELNELLSMCSRLKAHAFPYSLDMKYKVSDSKIKY